MLDLYFNFSVVIEKKSKKLFYDICGKLLINLKIHKSKPHQVSKISQNKVLSKITLYLTKKKLISSYQDFIHVMHLRVQLL